MYQFQQISIDLIDKNVFEMIGKNWMLITAGKEGKANTMTASWGGLGVMWGKNAAYIVVRDSRYTKEFLDSAGTFSLTFFENPPRGELKYLGGVSGRDEDKIKNARLEIGYAGNTPYVGNGNWVFICRKMSATRIDDSTILDKQVIENWYKDGDYHTLYIGEITGVLAR